MKAFVREVAKLACAALVICGVLLGIRAYDQGRMAPPKADRPSVYLISISQASYPDEDVTILRYSLNGIPQAQEFPIKASTEEFVAWLGTVGNVSGTIEGAK